MKSVTVVKQKSPTLEDFDKLIVDYHKEEKETDYELLENYFRDPGVVMVNTKKN